MAVTFLRGAAAMAIHWPLRGSVPRDFVLIHFHFGLVGWLALMVMGVAYWMFPVDKVRYAGRQLLPKAGAERTL